MDEYSLLNHKASKSEIRQLYGLLLGRAPENDRVVEELHGQENTVGDLIAAFVSSEEHRQACLDIATDH